MNCAFCKKTIEPETYYASIGIHHRGQDRYSAMVICAHCAHRLLKKDGKRVNLNGDYRLTVDMGTFQKQRTHIATNPMRNLYGHWFFAKPQVDGLF